MTPGLKYYRPKIISTYVMYSDEDGRFKAIVTVEEVKSETSSWESLVGAGISVKSKTKMYSRNILFANNHNRAS